MYNFYRRFIPKAAHILAPLIKFLEGHTNKKKPSRPSKKPQTPLKWTEEAENSFTAAKTALADATLLKHPIPGATFSVWTDASNFAIDRCKPAFEFSDFNSQKGSSNFEPPLTKQQIEDKTVVDRNIRTTRSGRHVHFPKRLTY
ncbi:RT_RNaseH_2 domain-containing protein [Trichonephila inaurata madagascariensis]|uniref:RT_RNaseH_2 domain-containing protein n=1 Tax=Trichonephila inaurata madagascariensis TaxID=2747483 RepID=A0A8X6XZM6_9ARAC|nr:RT_RNaseH_2 domain-containing protein [Trichonephila inaurata madagascariensis]